MADNATPPKRFGGKRPWWMASIVISGFAARTSGITLSSVSNTSFKTKPSIRLPHSHLGKYGDVIPTTATRTPFFRKIRQSAVSAVGDSRFAANRAARIPPHNSRRRFRPNSKSWLPGIQASYPNAFKTSTDAAPAETAPSKVPDNVSPQSTSNELSAPPASFLALEINPARISQSPSLPPVPMWEWMSLVSNMTMRRTGGPSSSAETAETESPKKSDERKTTRWRINIEPPAENNDRATTWNISFPLPRANQKQLRLALAANPCNIISMTNDTPNISEGGKGASFALDLKRASHASALLLAFTVLKSLLGLFLKRAIATNFGAGMETDAYFAAFTIPQQLGDFVIGGIVFKIVVPVFQKRREETGPDNAAKEISGVLNFSLLLLAILTAFFYLAAPAVTPLLFAGFDAETASLTTKLTRWLSPAIVLMGLSLIYTGLHHSFRSFLYPAIATLIFPISSLAAIYLLPDGWGIERLVYGNLAGTAFGTAFLLVSLKRRFKWRWNWDWANPALAATFAVAWPLLVSNVVGKVVPFAQKYAASGLPTGNVSYLEYAMFLSGAVAIFVVSPITSAVFPVMGEHKAKKDEKALMATFHETVGVVVFLATPCALFLGIESKEIVSTLLGSKRFTPDDVATCAEILSIVSIMIVPFSISFVISNMFMVHRETKAIALAGVATTLLSVPTYILAARGYGVAGIAATYAAFYSISPVIGAAILGRGRPGVVPRSFPLAAAKLLLSAAVAGGVAWETARLAASLPDWARLLLAGAALSATYWAATEALGIGRARFILSKFKASGE